MSKNEEPYFIDYNTPSLIEDQVIGGAILRISPIRGNEDCTVSTFNRKRIISPCVRIRSSVGGTRYQTSTTDFHAAVHRLRVVFGRFAQPSIFEVQSSFQFYDKPLEAPVPGNPDFIIVDDDINPQYESEVPYLSFYQVDDLLGIRASVRSGEINENRETPTFTFHHAPVVWLKPKEMPQDCSKAVLDFYEEAQKYKGFAGHIGMTYE